MGENPWDLKRHRFKGKGAVCESCGLPRFNWAHSGSGG